MAGLQPRSTMLPSSVTKSLRNLTITPLSRPFSTTRPVQRLPKVPETVPPYPYGMNQWFRQSNFGLYGGAMIRFGNKISKGRNKGRTRRNWKPHVYRKNLHSDALNKTLRVKVTHDAMRSIDKSGGLDKYLLDDRPSRIREMGIFGWQLRWRIMQSPKIKQEYQEQRKKLGIANPPTFKQWMKQKGIDIKEEVVESTNIKEETKPTYSKKVH